MKKNKLKRALVIILLAIMLPTMNLLTACSSGKNGTDGKDGKDGQDAVAIDYYQLYRSAVDAGEYSKSYTEFLKEVLPAVSMDYSAQVNLAMASVVAIQCKKNTTKTNGSGIIYSIDKNSAIVITNYHVVYNASEETHIYSEIYVSLYNEHTLEGNLTDYNRTLTASYIGGSRTYDIAVLKVENCNSWGTAGAKAVTFSTAEPKVGTGIFTIGNSLGAGLTATTGIISRVSDTVSVPIAGITSKYRLIRHCAHTTNGNSGGGLFDNNGYLLAMTSSGDTSNNFMNYAIPNSILIPAVQNILKNCNDSENTKIKHLALQISFNATDSLEFKQNETIFTEQILVDEVQQTANEQLKTLEKGDIITKISIQKSSSNVLTKELKHMYEVEEFLLNADAGDELVIHYIHEAQAKTISIELTDSDFIKID